jgi:putative secretion ATPase (PEP-CTERM system associated)
MYEIFYNFSAEPFRLSPDHRFCFEHKSYGKARAYMAYAFKRAEGFVMITGRPGTGKTTLIGELVESLSREKVVTANLVCTQLQADDLLKTVAYSFGISPSEVGKAELLQRLNTLLHRWHREGRRALLVVDEAQDLSPSAMEELRLLTNIQVGGQPLLQIFLLGQPELRDLILSPEMEQVHQRIVAASHIEGLEADETEAYVIHRLTVVGWRGDPAIDRAIFPLIHRFSEGVPRRINLICSRLFLLGSVEDRHTIELADVRVVIGELQAENLAAGTGISQQDFRDAAEPDWVQVPEDPAQPPPVPPLQAADNAASDHATEQAVEIKKKDIPSLEPLTSFAPECEPDISSQAIAGVEFTAGDDSTFEALASSEGSASALASATIPAGSATEIASDIEVGPASAVVSGALSDGVVTHGGPDGKVQTLSDKDSSAGADMVQVESGEGVGSLMAGAGGDVASPVSRKRLTTVFFFLVLMTIALAFVLKVCSITGEELSYKEQGQQSTALDLRQALVDTPAIAADAGRVGGISPRPERAVSNPGIELESVSGLLPTGEVVSAPQELMSIVVDADLRRAIPVGLLSTLQGGGLQDIDQPASADASTYGFLSEGDRQSALGETVSTQEWQEPILISFSFDSDDLIADAYLALDRAAKLLREDAARVASITGFTDSRGDSGYNLALSRKRADAVEQYLVDAGVARERLQVEGRGVLTSPIEGQMSGIKDPREPFRIVQIRLSEEG